MTRAQHSEDGEAVTVRTASLGTALAVTGVEEARNEPDAVAALALRQRPTLSIRTRLLTVFSLFLLLSLAQALWSMQMLSGVQKRTDFLEIADDYMAEIQQARRFEKNFLLYGTNLEDALEHTRLAQQLVTDHHRKFGAVVGTDAFATTERHLAEYERLLRQIGAGEKGEVRTRHEAALRSHGAEMYDFAASLVNKERTRVHSALSLAKKVPVLFLCLLIVVMIVGANFIARRIIGTLTRFSAYAKRIGDGDFTPITPVRRYRDEFTELALAINKMTHELDRRHRILVESHKLRALGTLVAGVAHEINNPLNNIMLTASVLQEEFADLDDAEKLEMVQDLITQADRSRNIVRNLLDYARESETRLEAINVIEILNETTRLLGNHLKVKKVGLDTSMPDTVPPVHGDRQLLGQVFMNLLMNALDATPEKSRIHVSVQTSKQESFVQVEVRDEGTGIPEHVLPRIFDPFFTTKPKGKGTGLGLSVARGIVHKLGGDIRVATRAGEGATFTVLLPLTSIPSEVSARRATAQAAPA